MKTKLATWCQLGGCQPKGIMPLVNGLNLTTLILHCKKLRLDWIGWDHGPDHGSNHGSETHINESHMRCRNILQKGKGLTRYIFMCSLSIMES